MRTDPRQKISPAQAAWAFERIDRGVPLKAIAAELGVDVSTLQRRLDAAERDGLDAFAHPALRCR